MTIRNSVKAIIIKEDFILTMKAKDKNGFYYLLPGGGQNHGETMIDALKRECLEEIGCNVKIGQLLLIREYIGNNHEFSFEDCDVHQIEHMFECEIASNETPKIGHEPDLDQIGIEWLNINDINRYRLYPQKLKENIVNKNRSNTIYYGDLN